MARTLTIFLRIAVAFLISCPQSHAQGPTFQSRVRQGMVGLALQAEIAREIGIADDAATMAEILKWSDNIVEESRRAMNEAFTQQQSISEETKRSLRTLHDEDLKSILTKEQFARLQQIDWQIRDRNAMAEPGVMDALEMTEGQQEKLIKAQQQFRIKVRDMATARRAKKIRNEDADQQMQELIAERDRSIELILTKSQQDKFTELKGKQFDGTDHYWYEKYYGGAWKPKSQ